MTKDTLDSSESVSRAAHFASLTSRSYLMPIFPEKDTNALTVSHTIRLLQGVTAHLNLGRVPWLQTDQPQQRKYPNKFGEDTMLVTVGGLHTCSGWHLVSSMVDISFGCKWLVHPWYTVSALALQILKKQRGLCSAYGVGLSFSSLH